MTEPTRRIDASAAGFWDPSIGDDPDARPQLPAVRRPAPQMVRPEPAPIIVQPRPTPEAPAWLAERAPFDVAPALMAQSGVREQTSAMDRAQALRVRLFPWLIAWSLIAIVVGVVVVIVVGNAPGAGLATLLTFAALTAFTYYKMDAKDYEYSREGTERHKVDVAADLALAEMDHHYELKKLALLAYLEHLQIGARDRG